MGAANGTGPELFASPPIDSPLRMAPRWARPRGAVGQRSAAPGWDLAILAQCRRPRCTAASCACSPTFRSRKIARIEALEGAEINAAKIVLANEVTSWCAATMPLGRPEDRGGDFRRRRHGRRSAGSPARAGRDSRAARRSSNSLRSLGRRAKRKLAEGAVKLDGLCAVIRLRTSACSGGEAPSAWAGKSTPSCALSKVWAPPRCLLNRMIAFSVHLTLNVKKREA